MKKNWLSYSTPNQEICKQASIWLVPLLVIELASTHTRWHYLPDHAMHTPKPLSSSCLASPPLPDISPLPPHPSLPNFTPNYERFYCGPDPPTLLSHHPSTNHVPPTMSFKFIKITPPDRLITKFFIMFIQIFAFNLYLYQNLPMYLSWG